MVMKTGNQLLQRQTVWADWNWAEWV